MPEGSLLGCWWQAGGGQLSRRAQRCHTWQRLSEQDYEHRPCFMVKVLDGQMVQVQILLEGHRNSENYSRRDLECPQECLSASRGFAKYSPGSPLGIRPPVNTLRPRFLASSEVNSRPFVPFSFLGKAQCLAQSPAPLLPPANLRISHFGCVIFSLGRFNKMSR